MTIYTSADAKHSSTPSLPTRNTPTQRVAEIARFPVANVLRGELVYQTVL